MIMNQTFAIESFILFCDDMMIAEESAFSTIKNGLIRVFTNLVNFLSKKVSKMKDTKLKRLLQGLLDKAKKCLGESKSMKEGDTEKAEELHETATEIKEKAEEVVNEEKESNNTKPNNNIQPMDDTRDVQVKREKDDDKGKPSDNKETKIEKPKTQKNNNDKLVEDIQKLVDKGDVKGLTYTFVDALDVDPTFVSYAAAYGVAKKCPGFPEPHRDLTPFEKDPSKWDFNYYIKLKLDYQKNPSEERFSHMRQVVKVVHKDKIKRILKERAEKKG